MALLNVNGIGAPATPPCHLLHHLGTGEVAVAQIAAQPALQPPGPLLERDRAVHVHLDEHRVGELPERQTFDGAWADTRAY
jgi:hypothetical protein